MSQRVMHYLQDDGLRYFTPCGKGSPRPFDATSSKRSVTCRRCRKALGLKVKVALPESRA